MSDAANNARDGLDAILEGFATPTNWRTIGREEAEQTWDELRHWVRWFVARYNLDAHIVPPCWYLHPALVDLLTALRDAHRGAHHRLAATSAPANWHITLWQCETRLRDWVSRTGCTRDQHHAETPINCTDDTDRWRQHVAADLTHRSP